MGYGTRLVGNPVSGQNGSPLAAQECHTAVTLKITDAAYYGRS